MATGSTGDQNGYAIASLVLGIIAFFIPFVAAILAIVFGVMGRNRAKQGAPNGGLALAGMILGIVFIAFWILIVILAIIGSASCNANPRYC